MTTSQTTNNQKPAGQKTNGQQPPDCSINCGGSAPQIPGTAVAYRCAIATFGCCPVLKSVKRTQAKHRRHRLGLWRRSRREFRQAIEAAAILTEFPDTDCRLPEGADERIRARAAHAGFQQSDYSELRRTKSIQSAVDGYLMLHRPFTPPQPRGLRALHPTASCSTN